MMILALTTVGALAVGAMVAGTAASVGTSIYSAHEQRKAAKAAAAASKEAANRAATVSTSTTAAEQTNTKAQSQMQAATAAARRFSVSRTVNRVNNTGLRNTLN